MKESVIDRINLTVEQAKNFPNCVIQYSCELPDVEGITPTSFFGVPANYNPQVSKDVSCMITYKY